LPQASEIVKEASVWGTLINRAIVITDRDRLFAAWFNLIDRAADVAHAINSSAWEPSRLR